MLCRWQVAQSRKHAGVVSLLRAHVSGRARPTQAVADDTTNASASASASARPEAAAATHGLQADTVVAASCRPSLGSATMSGRKRPQASMHDGEHAQAGLANHASQGARVTKLARVEGTDMCPPSRSLEPEQGQSPERETKTLPSKPKLASVRAVQHSSDADRQAIRTAALQLMGN